MKSAFVGHPLLAALFFCILAGWFVIESAQARRRRADATSGDRGSLVLVRVCAVAGLVGAALAQNVRAAAFGHSPITFAVSLGMMTAGIGLRWWSFRTLGRYFTFSVMTSADQPVIDTGPYRVLRHPSYAAMLLIFIGMSLSYDNWLSLAALTLLPLVGLVNRIRVEEAALVAALGPAYTTYASQRKRLVPFGW